MPGLHLFFVHVDRVVVGVEEEVPARQLGQRHAHGRDFAVMPPFFQAVLRQLLNVLVVGFLRPAVDVGVEAEVFVALVGLGKVDVPGLHLFFVHVDRVVVGVDPGGEFVEGFVVAVRTDAGVVAIVPVVDAADQVVASDGAVGEQGAAMQAAPVEDRDVVVVADDDEVYVGYQRVGGLAVFEFAPGGDFDRRCRQGFGRYHVS